MAIYNLTGAGAQALTSGTNRLLVDVTSFDARRSQGRATPTNYYDLGLLRVGVQGSYEPAFPIDAASMVFDLVSGATTLGYSLFGTTAIRVTEQVMSTSRPEPWDRNPQNVGATQLAFLAGGAALATAWDYTVPTARLLHVSHLSARVQRLAVPTTVGGCIARISIDGTFVLVASHVSNTVGAETILAVTAGPIILKAAQVIHAEWLNTDTGGNCLTQATMLGYLFDA